MLMPNIDNMGQLSELNDNHSNLDSCVFFG